MSIRAKTFVIYFSFLLLLNSTQSYAQSIGDYHSFKQFPHRLLFTTTSGHQLRLSAYTDYVIRIQAIRKGEDFFSDDHYEMVASHKMNGSFSVQDKGDHFEILTAHGKGLKIRIYKLPLR